ncbi:MAG TPA: carbon-nitrogen hydrolase family protein [Solirubrobacteraceae bacterium]|jgi:predicted amidohydrolase|nr:carbon-nitrogen hydrolase family protein [Solirubrobacteraceae bacterium]
MAPATTLRAAAVQLNATEDVDRNLQIADRLTRQAAGLGAELVVLPEKWTVLGRSEVMEEQAQTLDGPAAQWAMQTARELGIDLIAGSFVERRADQQKTSNTSLHLGPDGQIRAAYRKLHMFDVEVDGTVYAESAREQAGDEVVTTTVATNGEHPRRLGMTICYDVRFPELYRALSERGATIVTVPAAFTLATTRDHWETLLRARAIENQSFVIAANQIGEHPPGNRSGGRSTIIDPWGVVLATAPDSESAIIADLDFSLLKDVRERLPALTHRRAPQLYELRADPQSR